MKHSASAWGWGERSTTRLLLYIHHAVAAHGPSCHVHLPLCTGSTDADLLKKKNGSMWLMHVIRCLLHQQCHVLAGRLFCYQQPVSSYSYLLSFLLTYICIGLSTTTAINNQHCVMTPRVTEEEDDEQWAQTTCLGPLAGTMFFFSFVFCFY